MTVDKQAGGPSVYEVPEKKQTSLGLYVTAQVAYEMWKAEPDAVTIVDVRIPEEYIFVGHAPMARNIPLLFIKYQWDAEKDEPAITPNPAFVSRVKELHAPADTLLVTCRSGGRSAVAVNMLAQAGFTNVYNIIDGFEGDMVAEEGSAYLGKRMKNGWKNSGVPWTYACDTELLWIDGA
jgi:rhodanese-related sulfurtransferase